MNTLFDSPSMLLMGLISGIIFGFLLRKALVTRFDTIVGQFLLKDFTVIKVMMMAIVVGSIGIHLMHQLGIISALSIKNAFIYANVCGGIIFGIGMATLGLCPGTCVGAMGEGNIDALFGFLGMLFGVVFYAEIYDFLAPIFFSNLNLGKATLDSVTGISPWFYIIGLIIFSIILFKIIEKYEKA